LAGRPTGGKLEGMNETPAPRKLTRSRGDRVVGGVCGGMGRYFNVDPLFFRLGAVALAFVGGAGLLLYLAALILVPSEDAPARPADEEQRNRTLLIVAVIVGLILAFSFLLGTGLFLAGIGIPLALLVGAGVLVWWLVSGEGPSGDAGDVARRAALGVGVLIVCFFIAILGAIAAAVGPGWLIPAFVLLASVAIIGAAFVEPLRWLVLPAVTLALAGGFVAAVGIDADGGIGDRNYRPATSVDLRDHYKLGVGHLVVDLRDTELPKGDVPLKIDLGVGDASVLIPDGVCVATDAKVGMGNIDVLGNDHGGVDVDYQDARSAQPTTTRLLLRADIGIGQVKVRDRSGDFFEADHFNPLDDTHPIQQACST
jgi:phage shock protein PspC (stress-responsive transcriptional regulator)